MGLNVLSAFHGMSTIWDVRYREVSLYIENICHQLPNLSNFYMSSNYR